LEIIEVHIFSCSFLFYTLCDVTLRISVLVVPCHSLYANILKASHLEHDFRLSWKIRWPDYKILRRTPILLTHQVVPKTLVRVCLPASQTHGSPRTFFQVISRKRQSLFDVSNARHSTRYHVVQLSTPHLTLISLDPGNAYINTAKTFVPRPHQHHTRARSTFRFNLADDTRSITLT
jgi:hypothetical protein